MMRMIGSAILKTFLALLLLICISLTGQRSLACDADDELPGALPPAPNGGELGEAERINKISIASAEEIKASKPKLYWEGVHMKDEKQISLSLVAAIPPKTAVFTTLSPTQEFSDLRVKVELAREGKFITVPFSVTKDRVIVNFDGKGLNRFIVHIEGNRADGVRRASVQIEEE